MGGKTIDDSERDPFITKKMLPQLFFRTYVHTSSA